MFMEIKNDYKYEMVKNYPYGYRINKYEYIRMTGEWELIDFVVGATAYSLEYWFYNPDKRTNNKQF